MSESVCILGSTGSIGTSTLDVIERNSQNYSVEVLTAHSNHELLLAQCKKFHPKLAVMVDKAAGKTLKARLAECNLDIQVETGVKALNEAANYPGLSTVVAAIVGAAGLLPTLAAVKQGCKVLLANKEALVMSGNIFTKAVKQYGATLLPVDSEHNAIFQCLNGVGLGQESLLEGVHKILLTGSGGPFRTIPLKELQTVTPEQACAHPNWDMGKKISVDSATMMNKGLELIEACFLFDMDISKIDIVVHPQSIVHSMVSYLDGSVLAQMGRPDMRTPIAHTLAWPQRIDAGVEPLDFYQMSNLTFEAPDYERFPCLRLAQEALKRGGSAPCVVNAANEVAVEAFLNGEIRFTQIAQVIELTLKNSEIFLTQTIEQVLQADQNARTVAQSIIEKEIH